MCGVDVSISLDSTLSFIHSILVSIQLYSLACGSLTLSEYLFKSLTDSIVVQENRKDLKLLFLFFQRLESELKKTWVVYAHLHSLLAATNDV